MTDRPRRLSAWLCAHASLWRYVLVGGFNSLLDLGLFTLVAIPLGLQALDVLAQPVAEAAIVEELLLEGVLEISAHDRCTRRVASTPVQSSGRLIPRTGAISTPE